MRKALVLMAAAAAVLAVSCNKESSASIELQENVPVNFGTKTSNSITRAGDPLLMDDAHLKLTGFGVFAYHTDASASQPGYIKSGTDASLPNFMWNQEVTYGTKWGYNPIKYWPNEHGDKASSGTNIDKVSFFAYAPYVTAPAGAEVDGIMALTANNIAGDPKVTYRVANKPEENVDLVWAVAPDDVTYINADGDNVTIAKEMPYIDLSKPKTGHQIDFLFKHATAKLGLNVIGIFDEGSKDDNTKITIKSVTIKGQFAREAVLNLNNITPGVANWESKSYDAGDVTTLVIDKDNNLRDLLIDAGDVVFASQPAGVLASKQNVMSDDVMYNLIPGSISEVIIDYFVTTNDSKLSKTYSRVENNISYTFATPLALENNKYYTIDMQLGMTTVKMSATVAGWGGENATTIDLPANVD